MVRKESMTATVKQLTATRQNHQIFLPVSFVQYVVLFSECSVILN